MPSDAYMEVAPTDILGESSDQAYGADTPYAMFEIFSVGFETGNTYAGLAAASTGPGDTVAPSNDSENRTRTISVEKPIDKSSPFLFRYCCEKTVMDWAIIYIREAGEENNIPWLRIELRKVQVTNFTWGIDPGSGGDEVTKAEKLTLEFQTMLINYCEQAGTGTHDQMTTSMNMWNFADQNNVVDPIS